MSSAPRLISHARLISTRRARHTRSALASAGLTPYPTATPPSTSSSTGRRCTSPVRATTTRYIYLLILSSITTPLTRPLCSQNWGAQPANVTVKSWYWGHARAGPYSIVWFTAIAPDGSLHTSSYLSSTGHVLASSCEPSSLTVTPVTNPGESQPDGLPDGFDLAVAVPGQGTLQVQVKNAARTQLLPGIAGRWIGSVSASFGNGTQWTGVAFYEQFQFQ